MIAEPSIIRRFSFHDGFIYWLAQDGVLRRTGIHGGAIETIAVGLSTDYTIFEDRLLFTTENGLYWQALSGGAPALLLPRSGITGIAAVTRDAGIVSTRRHSMSIISAQSFACPGRSAVETIYNTRSRATRRG